MAPPWDGFCDDVRAAVGSLVVSHRLSRRVNAALHEETHYSKVHQTDDGKCCVHVRKPLEALSEKELDAIVDPAVARLVRAKLDDLGIKEPRRAFATRDNHPALPTKDGREIPIHSVRIRKVQSVESVGAGARERRVALGSNHHIEILESTDQKAAPRWQGVAVTSYEAMTRLRANQPVVQREHGQGKEFKFSLAAGETIEMDDGPDGERGLYVVAKVTKRGHGDSERVTVGIVRINDARKSTGKAKDKVRELQEPSPEVLRTKHCRKVLVTPLGEVRRAND